MINNPFSEHKVDEVRKLFSDRGFDAFIHHYQIEDVDIVEIDINEKPKRHPDPHPNLCSLDDLVELSRIFGTRNVSFEGITIRDECDHCEDMRSGTFTIKR